jgi:hypothetical protein
MMTKKFIPGFRSFADRLGETEEQQSPCPTCGRGMSESSHQPKPLPKSIFGIGFREIGKRLIGERKRS